MSSQHLSDEAVAAFADGVLRGSARERATRHVDGCPECGYSVAVQREAILALRAAAAPSLPGGLLARLSNVPTTTPLTGPPTTIGPNGQAMFAAYGTRLPANTPLDGPIGGPFARMAGTLGLGAAAAFGPHPATQSTAPHPTARHRRRRMPGGTIGLTVAALATAGVLSTAAAGDAAARSITTHRPAAPAGVSRVSVGH